MVSKAYSHNRKFIERRFIKRMKAEVGELPSDKIALCEQLAKEYNPIPMKAGCFLYKLAYYSNDPDEIKTNLKLFIDSDNKIPYTTNSREQIEMQFGIVEANIIISERSIKFSNYCKEQIKSGKSKIGKEMSELATAKIIEIVKNDHLFHRKKNKSCPEYYTSRGIYDSAEIERLISEHNKKMVPCTKEKIIS